VPLARILPWPQPTGQVCFPAFYLSSMWLVRILFTMPRNATIPSCGTDIEVPKDTLPSLVLFLTATKLNSTFRYYKKSATLLCLALRKTKKRRSENWHIFHLTDFRRFVHSTWHPRAEDLFQSISRTSRGRGYRALYCASNAIDGG
jgi:hypothetical protein